MSDPDIERIVSDVRMEWVRQGSPTRTEEEMMRRAAELAVAKERDKAKGINMESLRLFDYLLNHSNARVLLSDGFKKDASDLVAQIRSKP